MRVALRSGLGPVLVAVALAFNNVAGYAVTVLAARMLAPGLFGGFSAVLAVLLVGVVPALGVQTAVALRVAAGEGDRRALTGLGLATAAAVVVTAALAAPVLGALLRLDGAMAIALALGPMTLNGLWYGLLQGQRRFGALARLLVLESACRVGGALAGLAIGRTPGAAVVGIAVGVAVSTAAGWVLCGRPAPTRPGGAVVREAARAARALLALVVLVNLDLVLARYALPPDAAGEYAVGAVVTKVAYWLPYAVSVVVLPRLATGGRRTVPVALAVCAGLDAVVIAGSVLFGQWGMRVVGGSAYAESTLALWPFALVGTLLALAQVLLYSRIARAGARASLVTWLAVAVEVVLVVGWLNDTPAQVVAAAVAATGFLVVAGAVAERRAR
jgi:O-antigen/teichoic acid export membrane protein